MSDEFAVAFRETPFRKAQECDTAVPLGSRTACGNHLPGHLLHSANSVVPGQLGGCGPYSIRSVEADAAADGSAETAELLERLLAYPDVRAVLKTFATDVVAGPVLPMHFLKGNVSLQLFTTIATLGTPQDITAQELRIESFFPMNDDTARTIRAWG
jgi:hypothetical protein